MWLPYYTTLIPLPNFLCCQSIALQTSIIHDTQAENERPRQLNPHHRLSRAVIIQRLRSGSRESCTIFTTLHLTLKTTSQLSVHAMNDTSSKDTMCILFRMNEHCNLISYRCGFFLAKIKDCNCNCNCDVTLINVTILRCSLRFRSKTGCLTMFHGWLMFITTVHRLSEWVTPGDIVILGIWPVSKDL